MDVTTLYSMPKDMLIKLIMHIQDITIEDQRNKYIKDDRELCHLRVLSMLNGINGDEAIMTIKNNTIHILTKYKDILSLQEPIIRINLNGPEKYFVIVDIRNFLSTTIDVYSDNTVSCYGKRWTLEQFDLLIKQKDI